MAQSTDEANRESSAEAEKRGESQGPQATQAPEPHVSITVGDIKETSGKVQVAGGDIITHEHYEQVSKAKDEKEFQANEREDLRAALLEKQVTLQGKRFARVESVLYHTGPLALHEGRYLLGRSELLDQLAGKIESGQSIYLSGAGGVGKTSLLRAGLMPRLLEHGDLPVLVTISPEESPSRSIRRSLLTRVESTKHLSELGLADFLEEASKLLPGEGRLVLILDGFETMFEPRQDQDAEKRREQDLRELLTEWGYTGGYSRLVWIFSLDSGFKKKLTPSQQDKIVEVPPLTPEAAAQALVAFEQSRHPLEAADREEILNGLGRHRETIRGGTINPAELQVVLKALAEGDPGAFTTHMYARGEWLSGVFADHLEGIVKEKFGADDGPVVWQILTLFRDEYGKPVAADRVGTHLTAYGYKRKDIPDLLQRLRQEHVIKWREEKYELAHVLLMSGIQRWLRDQTVLKKARQESLEQLNNIRDSALRGMFGGALGFGGFRWIVGGPVRDVSAIVFFTLLYAVIGGLSGLLLTFLIDVFIAGNRSSRPRQRYLLSAGTGLLTFALGLALFVYLSEPADDKPLQFILSIAVGGAWGIVIGAGIAWALRERQLQWRTVFLIALAGALTLFLTNLLLPVLNRAAPPLVFLGGLWVPLVLLAFILFLKRAEPE